MFSCIGSSLLHTGFLQLRRAGTTLHRNAQSSHCGGFSCGGARALGARASVVVARGLSSCGSRALERSFSSCGARAQLLHGMWDLPRPGIELVSPALAGRFLTTVPPGKSQSLPLNWYVQIIYINVIVDMLGFKYAILFCLFCLFAISCLSFLPSCGLLEHFQNSVLIYCSIFECISLHSSFSAC